MAESRTGNVIKNSGASLLARFAHLVFRFALRTAFIRLLGNEYTGISGLFNDILSVLNLMEMGLDMSMVFSLYSPVANNDQWRISALLKFYKKIFTVIGIVILAAGVACIPFLQYVVKGVPNIKEDIRLIFLMYILTSASSYFLIYKTMLLRAKQRNRVVSMVQVVVETVETILAIVLLLILKEFFAYLTIHLIATWIKNIYLSRLSVKMYPESFQPNEAELTREERNKLIRDIACLTVYTLSGVVINSTDSIFISAFVGTVEVAIVGNFTLLISSIRTVVQQINNSLKSSVGNLAATSTPEKQELVFNRIVFIAFWAVCFTSTCLFVLLDPFVGEIWLGKSYEISTQVLVVLMLNYFIAVMVFPVESFRTSNGLFVQGWARPAIMAVMNIVLDYFMGKQWGIIGIFLATTISRLLTQVWFDPYLVYKAVFHKSPFTFYKKYVIYACITAISCALATFATGFITVANPYISFILKAAIAVVIPNLIIVALFHSSGEFSYVRGLLLTYVKKLHKK